MLLVALNAGVDPASREDSLARSIEDRIFPVTVLGVIAVIRLSHDGVQNRVAALLALQLCFDDHGIAGIDALSGRHGGLGICRHIHVAIRRRLLAFVDVAVVGHAAENDGGIRHAMRKLGDAMQRFHVRHDTGQELRVIGGSHGRGSQCSNSKPQGLRLTNISVLPGQSICERPR